MITYRNATSDDIEKMHTLLKESGLHTEDVAACDFMVALSDGAVVGGAGLEMHGNQGLLRSLVVNPSFRGQGVGRDLVDLVVARASEMALEEVFVLTTSAAPYFRRLGFARVDRSTIEGPVTSSLLFTTLCPESAAAMVIAPGSMEEAVNHYYGSRARDWLEGARSSCCQGACDCMGTADPGMMGCSLGCGSSPVDRADLRPGLTVLDLGSGAGLEVLRAARKVGDAGRALGLEADPHMLKVAFSNRDRAGITNADFIPGHMEEIPLLSASVDVVISNCVINLSRKKDQVFAEIMRVLKPRGRLVVSDVVHLAPLPHALASDPRAWADCLSGTLSPAEFRDELARTGFTSVTVDVDEEGRFQEVFAPALITATRP